MTDFTTTAEKRAQSLRDDLTLARHLTGTVQADTHRGYYPAMDRIFDALEEALDARGHLAQQEDDGHDGWCGCGCQDAQEPTDAEIEAAARELHFPKYVTEGTEWDDLRDVERAMLRSLARKVLTAAREATR